MNSQKQLLIDTILREYDVPKLYWRKTGSKPEVYDVVDGQQRLRAIWEFFDGKFKLPKDADNVDGEKIASCKYQDLPDELRIRFDTYSLDVVTPYSRALKIRVGIYSISNPICSTQWPRLLICLHFTSYCLILTQLAALPIQPM